MEMKNTDLSAFYVPDNKKYASKSFWGWNGKLESEELRAQIRYFEKMGMQGFYMHPRIGLDTEYLGNEFMDMVEASIDEAKKLGMKAELYDEDGYPSGSAGGRSTNEIWARARYIFLTDMKQENAIEWEDRNRKEPWLIASYDIEIGQEGTLASYKRLSEGETAEGHVWYAYMVPTKDSGWHNRQSSLDVLNPDAMKRFLQVTHEEYKKRFAGEFGKTMTSCFTDEPSYPRMKPCDSPFEVRQIMLPWTPDFASSFQEKYEFDILDKLVELVWETNGTSHMRVRYCYYNHLAELFEKGFFEPYAKWCRENGLMFTGHMPEEQFLQSQAGMAGDCMRYYQYFDVPGIDLIRNQLEYPTAKQTQSIMHQQGKNKMMSEMYGVTNWNFDFRSQKYGGDWQAAMGVTERVIHLSWYTMKGEAKRDCPPPFGYQQPWCEEYHLLEDHYARLNSILVQGEPLVRIGMIHPLESFWMYMGSNRTTGEMRKQLEEEYNSAIAWMMEGTLDFDYINEEMLPKQYVQSEDAALHVGKMKYDAIVVPSLRTIRKTTITILEDFCSRGGKLIVMGKIPAFVDGIKSKEAVRVCEKAHQIAFERNQLLEALDAERTVSIYVDNWLRTDNLIYTMRQVQEDRWIFIAHSKETEGRDALLSQKIKLVIQGFYHPVLFDTVTGKEVPLECIREAGRTIINYPLCAHDSMLIRLREAKELNKADEASGIKELDKADEPSEIKEWDKTENLNKSYKTAYSLSEENVCLLDTAQYSLDGQAYAEEEDLYKISEKCGQAFGILTPEYYQKEEQFTDTWLVRRDNGPVYHVHLRFCVMADREIRHVSLACENIESLSLNGREITLEACGYYADKSIRKYKISDLKQGENIIDVKIPYSAADRIEYCYLTGRFGVVLQGRCKVLTSLPEELGFASIHNQKLPFYGGRVTYHVPIIMKEAGRLLIRVPSFRCLGVKVLVDEKECGIVAFSPYEIETNKLEAGEHKVDFVVLGNRYNIFGGIHNFSDSTYYCGNYFMSSGDAWGYEYRLKEIGLLSSPQIFSSLI